MFMIWLRSLPETNREKGHSFTLTLSTFFTFCTSRDKDPHHFPALAPQIARSRRLLKTTMGIWEGLQLRKRPLTCCLSGSVHIHDHKLLAHTIPQAAWGSEHLSRHQVLLKERPKRLHRRLIECRKKTRERRAVWQAISPKERHKRRSKRQESLVIRLEGGFAAQRIADKHDDKIDHIVVTK